MDIRQQALYPDNPFYYLDKYKSTKRPRVCVRCGHTAYYYHPDWDWTCASHLLDLVNIGGRVFDWEEYPEVWERTERLLKRPLKQNMSITVNNVVSELEISPATDATRLDG